ncbi:MAG: hypothetical protein KC613_20780 [Myxococcales bacterium]|nr:hypothetical protein [Myxococcales bacterium]
MRRLGLNAILSLGLAAGLAAPAQASSFPLTLNDQWVFPLGFDQAVAFGGDTGPGYVLGLEASVVRLDASLWWAGLVGSVRRDYALDPVIYAVGGELGWAFLGFEAAAEFEDGEVGGRFRFVFPLGLGAPYVGWRTAHDTRWEAGLLLKFPIGLE